MRCATIGWAIGVMAVGVMAIGGAAQAGTIGGCMKPGVPVCMDDTTTFVSADKMAACQFEVKEYVDRTMDYLTCLNDENITTGQQLTRGVERFNCRLSGGRACD